MASEFPEPVSKVQPEESSGACRRKSAPSASPGPKLERHGLAARVRNWTDGDDARPANTANHSEQVDEHVQETHLDAGALVMVEIPLGDIVLAGGDGDTAVVNARKKVWGISPEVLKTNSEQIEIAVHGTDLDAQHQGKRAGLLPAPAPSILS